MHVAMISILACMHTIRTDARFYTEKRRVRYATVTIMTKIVAEAAEATNELRNEVGTINVQ